MLKTKNHAKSSECWVHVDEKRGKNGNRERSQKAVRPVITETRNSFEPLRRINEAQVEARNEDNRSANNDDRSFRRPSYRPSDVSTQRTNQSVSTESTTKRDQTQPNRRKKVMIARDSVLKHLQGHKSLEIRELRYPPSRDAQRKTCMIYKATPTKESRRDHTSCRD